MNASSFRIPLIIRTSLALVAILLSLACGQSGRAADSGGAIPEGEGSTTVTVSGDLTMTVFTYKPQDYHGAGMLVVLHGLTRDAENYRGYAEALADRHKLLVIAPLFDKEHFPGKSYNMGGVRVKDELAPQAEWAYSRLGEVIKEVRIREGNAELPYTMVGHSAGGQFVMRYAALMPAGAVRLVAMNPGTDLFPRTDWEFGYGFGGLPAEFQNDAALQRYLAAPLTLYLGQNDINPQHPELDKSAAAELQGAFRLERGRACFDFAKKLAEERGWKFNWRKVEAPGVAHFAKKMLDAKEAEEALFGKL